MQIQEDEYNFETSVFYIEISRPFRATQGDFFLKHKQNRTKQNYNEKKLADILMTNDIYVLIFPKYLQNEQMSHLWV